jgi:hypothetical protein
MYKVGDWVKTSQTSSDYIRIIELNESDSKGVGYLYGYHSKYSKRRKPAGFNTNINENKSEMYKGKKRIIK